MVTRAEIDQHRVVVVTGASAGLGRAIARAFAERGAAVGLLARGKEGLAGAERKYGTGAGAPSEYQPTSLTPGPSRRRPTASSVSSGR